MTILAEFISFQKFHADYQLATIDKKQHILTTAKNLFLSRGFKATTIQNIADAANVSKGAVYLHFSSKQDIIFEIAVQTEEVIWQQVQNIRADESLDPRDQLERILETYIDYIHENRLLNELLVQEVGLALSDEMLAETMALRQRWQQAIDSSVADLLGDEFEQWQSDLGFCLNAVMEGFHALLLVEKLEIPTGALIQFLLSMVETMGPALKKRKIPPLINKDYLDKRSKQLKGMESKRRSEIKSLLKKISEAVSSQKPANSDQSNRHKLLMETVQILKKECESEEPNKAIVQGMLASLKSVGEISQYRQQLAILMGVN